MIDRLVMVQLRERLGRYPAVALIGARQSGKTTLARQLSAVYFDLEQPADQTRLDAVWDSVIAGHELIILDEAQAWPALFPRIRGAIDADRRRNGRFLILGSVAPYLITHVSESLAGRLSLVEITPFIAGELPHVQLDDLWLRGTYPDGCGLHPDAFPQWQRDYLTLLVQRDLPLWGLPARPHETERLIAMLAAVAGQPWNATQLAQSLGISRNTVNSYLDYLEGAFLIRRLPAYSANVRKRLIKSPKVHWRDSGLLHATLNVSSLQDLLRRPWVGASWEGFVIGQILDTLTAHGRRANAFHFRTSDQHELDLVLAHGQTTWAIEIKLTSSPSPDDLARLRKRGDMVQSSRNFLVCRTKEDGIGARDAVISVPTLLDLLVKQWSP